MSRRRTAGAVGTTPAPEHFLSASSSSTNTPQVSSFSVSRSVPATRATASTAGPIAVPRTRLTMAATQKPAARVRAVRATTSNAITPTLIASTTTITTKGAASIGKETKKRSTQQQTPLDILRGISTPLQQAEKQAVQQSAFSALQLLQSMSTPLRKEQEKKKKKKRYKKKKVGKGTAAGGKKRRPRPPKGSDALPAPAPIRVAAPAPVTVVAPASGPVSTPAAPITTGKNQPAPTVRSDSGFFFAPAHPDEFAQLMRATDKARAAEKTRAEAAAKASDKATTAAADQISATTSTPAFVKAPPLTRSAAETKRDNPKSKLVRAWDNIADALADSLGVVPVGSVPAGNELPALEQKQQQAFDFAEGHNSGNSNPDDQLAERLAWCENTLREKDEAIAEMRSRIVDATRRANDANAAAETAQAALAKLFAKTERAEAHAAAFGRAPGASVGPMPTDMAHLARVLQAGGVFIKHGRRGSPHPRAVWVSQNLKRICWRVPGSSNRAKEKFIWVKDVVDLVTGQETGVFHRRKGRDARAHCSFSFITNDPERTLDLEVDLGPGIPDAAGRALEQEARDAWVLAFTALLQGRLANSTPPSHHNEYGDYTVSGRKKAHFAPGRDASPDSALYDRGADQKQDLPVEKEGYHDYDYDNV